MGEYAIGERIRECRTRKGWSGSDLGSRLYRPRTHAAISDIERGRTVMTMPLAGELAQALDCTVEWLLFGTKEPTGDAVDWRGEYHRLLSGIQDHWLYQWACDEFTHTDTGACSCGRFSTGPQPNIGTMVRRWLLHVTATLALEVLRGNAGGPGRAAGADGEGR